MTPLKGPENLARWGGGLASIAGGVLWSAKAILDGVGPGSGADRLFFIVPLLLLVGLVGLYGPYAGHTKGLGKAGFTQAFVGLALLAGGFAASLTLGVEGAVRVSSFGFLILAFGLILLGLEFLKTEPLPSWNFLPLALGLLVPLATIAGDLASLRMAFSVLFGLGWAMLGYLLLRLDASRNV